MWLKDQVTDGANSCPTESQEILGGVESDKRGDGAMRLKSMQTKLGRDLAQYRDSYLSVLFINSFIHLFIHSLIHLRFIFSFIFYRSAAILAMVMRMMIMIMKTIIIGMKSREQICLSF